MLLCGFLVIGTSCKDDKTYAELLQEEQDSIDKYGITDEIDSVNPIFEGTITFTTALFPTYCNGYSMPRP